VASTVTVTTTARESTHPATYAAPFVPPLRDARITMNAVKAME